MNNSYLRFIKGHKEIKILIRSIYLIKINNTISSLICTDKSTQEFHKPLSVIYGYLPGYFFQVNRSTVINLEQIFSLKLKDRKIILRDLTELSISSRRLTALKDALRRNNIYVS